MWGLSVCILGWASVSLSVLTETRALSSDTFFLSPYRWFVFQPSAEVSVLSLLHALTLVQAGIWGQRQELKHIRSEYWWTESHDNTKNTILQYIVHWKWKAPKAIWKANLKMLISHNTPISISSDFSLFHLPHNSSLHHNKTTTNTSEYWLLKYFKSYYFAS